MGRRRDPVGGHLRPAPAAAGPRVDARGDAARRGWRGGADPGSCADAGDRPARPDVADRGRRAASRGEGAAPGGATVARPVRRQPAARRRADAHRGDRPERAGGPDRPGALPRDPDATAGSPLVRCRPGPAGSCAAVASHVGGAGGRRIDRRCPRGGVRRGGAGRRRPGQLHPPTVRGLVSRCGLGWRAPRPARAPREGCPRRDRAGTSSRQRDSAARRGRGCSDRGGGSTSAGPGRHRGGGRAVAPSGAAHSAPRSRTTDVPWLCGGGALLPDRRCHDGRGRPTATARRPRTGPVAGAVSRPPCGGGGGRQRARRRAAPGGAAPAGTGPRGRGLPPDSVGGLPHHAR